MLRVLPPIVEPDTWVLAFQRTAIYPWQRWLPGTYKHVWAFAFVVEMDCYVLYDLWLRSTRIRLMPYTEANINHLTDLTMDCDLVKMPAKPGGMHLGMFSCVSAVAHLVGARGVAALTPTLLHRWCMRNGGEDLGRPKD